ncbi:MAG: isoprenoid biosynthesis glyoxalase ElbB [Myxococcales bacterium FL481]|nr:MAG: isoprenoid biosynthesis glyoxalase ElbB [Myxococcales bacterium FL481]
MSKVGVVLSGCGFRDGAEIQEAVLTLYFLERAGIEFRCYAPDQSQSSVVNHLTGEPTDEQRNVLVESARIARGEIDALERADMAELDALVLPGGFGAALNLSDFSSRGANATVQPDLARLVVDAANARKPIVAICISPAVLAVALSQAGLTTTLTIGNDADTAAAITQSGSTHETCPVDGVVVDEVRRIVSTPAYMLGPGPKRVGAGIEAAVAKLADWLAT